MGSALPGGAGGTVLSELIPPGPEFADLFQSFDHTSFRLEVRDRYDATGEEGPLRRFLETRVVDQEWRVDWLNMLREHRAAGKRWHRVRVVSTPLSVYNDWGIRSAEASNEAGDDIRYLDRKDATGLPDYDYWLFDSRIVAKMHFTDDDKLIGAELIDDPATVVEHNYWRDAALHQATTRDDFAAQLLDQL